MARRRGSRGSLVRPAGAKTLQSNRPSGTNSQITLRLASGIDPGNGAATRSGRHDAGTDGPSWLSFIGHMKDSLWSVDLFRCESIFLRSHWIMVVMDVFTRRTIGFGVERADPCGVVGDQQRAGLVNRHA